MRTACFVVVAAGLSIATGTALAQPMEVVTVEAARSATVGQSSYGVPIREVTIQSRVSYADLDLTSASGALELENRITKAAKSACEQIKIEIPAEGSTEAKCVQEAVDGAMVEARKAIDAKRK